MEGNYLRCEHTLHHAKDQPRSNIPEEKQALCMKINLKSYTMEKARGVLKEGKEAVIIAVGNIFEEADKAKDP